jgi:ATP-dependent Clp protease protease subunit
MMGVSRINKFWNFSTANGQRELRLDGVIAEESWYDDAITPAAFRAELFAGTGDLTLWINSPGGDVFAAAEIYTALKEYSGTHGKVTVKIDALAASAASVIAMAGDTVLISPVGHILIHNPWTLAIGDAAEMQKAKETLAAVKENILTAYERKTGLQRKELSRMMDAESMIPANKAVELGFADAMLYEPSFAPTANLVFSRAAVMNALLQKLKPCNINKNGTSIQAATARLNLLSGGFSHV